VQPVILDTLPTEPPAARTTPPTDLLPRLASLAELPYVIASGLDYCALCPFQTSTGMLAAVGPDGALYSAPLLLMHYIAEHGYAPPAAFVEAALHGVRHDSPARVQFPASSDQFMIAPPPRPAVTMYDIVFWSRLRFDKRYRMPLDVKIELNCAPAPSAEDADGLVEALMAAVHARVPESPTARDADVVQLRGEELEHPYLRQVIASTRIVRRRFGAGMWSARLARA
jgi:hypothetical protein